MHSPQKPAGHLAAASTAACLPFANIATVVISWIDRGVSTSFFLFFYFLDNEDIVHFCLDAQELHVWIDRDDIVSHLLGVQETNSRLVYHTLIHVISKVCLDCGPGLLTFNEPWAFINTQVMGHLRKKRIAIEPHLKKKKSEEEKRKIKKKV